MVQETLSLAESLTPGPLAPLTQLLIIAAWSSLESYNDMKNLEAGNRIPLMKSSATWKISLSSVRSGEFSEGMIGKRFQRRSELRLLSGNFYC